MKMKKVLAILLSAVMLITMSVTAFGETYVFSEFADGYVIVEENFADGEINSDLLTADGMYEFYDEGIEFRADSTLNADLAGAGKSVNSGIVNVSFSFIPSIDGCEEINNVATQKFDFGGGFVLEAQWTEYGSYSTWLKDGKFVVDDKEVMKFNADGTGGVDAGLFRAYNSESTAPSLYYEIDAKINLDTNKINLAILEKETTTSDETESVTNLEFDYKADAFGYFTESFTSTYDLIPFYSRNGYLNITTGDGAAYEDLGGIEPVVTRTYPDGYTFVKDSDANITFDPSGNYTHYIDLKEKAVTSGIVNASLKFSPNGLGGGTPLPQPASQKFEFGDGFNVVAKWSSYGANANKLSNCRFEIGNTVLTMNADGWNMGEAGTVRLIGMEANGAVGTYEINAKINLDTKKVYLTIIEHLVCKDQRVDRALIENGEFEYSTNVFDYYKNQLTTAEPQLRSQQSSLLIVADGECSYNSEDDNEGYKYPANYIFRQDNDTCFVMENEKSYKVELVDSPVTDGIINISYKFWPNLLHWGGLDGGKAKQTFNLGEGFSFSANWETLAGGGHWMQNAQFEVAGETIGMNQTGIWGAYSLPGTLRRKGVGGGAEGAYDISAQINLNTKKVNLKIVETLTNGENTPQVTTLVEKEYPYNSNMFSYYETSLASNDTVPATAQVPNRMISDNSSLLIKADGVVSYNPPKDIVLKTDSATQTLNSGNKEYKVTLDDKAVVGGKINVSFKFWPNTIASPDYKEARQVFDFGGGFALKAVWRSFGGNASWIYKGWIETYPTYTWKWFNNGAWGANTDNLGPGCIRVKDANASSPHAYYDVSAQIDLDAKKIYLTVLEHLETATEERTALLWDNVAFDYNADSFDYYKATFETYDVNGSAPVADTYLHSLNSNFLIQTKGNVTFKGTEEEEFIVNDTVVVKNGAEDVTTFAAFSNAQSPSVNLKFKNSTGEAFNAVLVIAYYKGDQLVKIDAMKNITADAVYDKIEYNYNFGKADVDADSVKVFVWDDITGITPLKKPSIMK